MCFFPLLGYFVVVFFFLSFRFFSLNSFILTVAAEAHVCDSFKNVISWISVGVCARTHSAKLFNLWTCFAKDAKDSMQVVDAFTVYAVRFVYTDDKKIFTPLSLWREQQQQQKKTGL